MKKILIYLMLAISSFSQAQKADSTTFNIAVNFVTNKIIEFDSSNKCGKYDSILLNEIDNNQKKWQSSWDLEHTLTFVSDSLFSDTTFKKSPVSIKTNTLDSFKTKLNFGLNKIFLASLDKRIKDLEKSNWLNYFLPISLFLLLTALVVILIARIKKNKKESHLTTDDIYKVVLDKILHSQTLNAHIRNRTDERINQKQNVAPTISQIKSDPEEQQIYPTKASEITLEENSFSSSKELENNQKVEQIFFLSTPNAEGSFNDSSASTIYREGASMYRFTKVNDTKAKFQIDERDDSIKLALQYPDRNILPVCEPSNEFEIKHTRIITQSPGEAVLQNGKWVVNKSQKAKIQYES